MIAHPWVGQYVRLRYNLKRRWVAPFHAGIGDVSSTMDQKTRIGQWRNPDGRGPLWDAIDGTSEVHEKTRLAETQAGSVSGGGGNRVS